MKKSKFGNVVLCEHVSAGELNKHILINTYSGDIVVPNMPANIFLGLYLEIYSSKIGEEHIHIEVAIDDKIFLEGDALAYNTSVGQLSVLTLPGFIGPFQKDGVLSISVAQEDMAKTVAMKKKVFAGLIPTSPAVPPPA